LVRGSDASFTFFNRSLANKKTWRSLSHKTNAEFRSAHRQPSLRAGEGDLQVETVMDLKNVTNRPETAATGSMDLVLWHVSAHTSLCRIERC
jgi:hypothetical protein